MNVTPLLAITAMLLLVSGLVKLRAVARVGLGIGILPLAEVLVGLALLALAIAGPPGAPVGLGAILLAVLLLLGSSFQVGTSLGRLRRARERSEGARLMTYVRYLPPSVVPDAAGGPAEGEGPAAPDRSVSTHLEQPRVQPNDPPGPGKSR
jgi:hypothetical protein